MFRILHFWLPCRWQLVALSEAIQSTSVAIYYSNNHFPKTMSMFFEPATESPCKLEATSSLLDWLWPGPMNLDPDSLELQRFLIIELPSLIELGPVSATCVVHMKGLLEWSLLSLRVFRKGRLRAWGYIFLVPGFRILCLGYGKRVW